MNDTRDQILTAKMVLEFLNEQYANDNFETGIDSGQLIWLAHSILQNGLGGLTEQQTAYLEHLKGTAMQQ